MCGRRRLVSGPHLLPFAGVYHKKFSVNLRFLRQTFNSLACIAANTEEGNSPHQESKTREPLNAMVKQHKALLVVTMNRKTDTIKALMHVSYGNHRIPCAQHGYGKKRL